LPNRDHFRRRPRPAQAARLEPGSRLGRELAAHPPLQSFEPRLEVGVFDSQGV